MFKEDIMATLPRLMIKIFLTPPVVLMWPSSEMSGTRGGGVEHPKQSDMMMNMLKLWTYIWMCVCMEERKRSQEQDEVILLGSSNELRS
ncbi:hypothetical protein AAHA92_28930 [Salvia divinorum]|uniref:Uncharacterized protein n=1 Tax=Salvia divinorum TaxID=28513 RepID=A0ABD1FWM8_SALDI